MLPNTGKAAYSIRRIRLVGVVFFRRRSSSLRLTAVCSIGRRARAVTNARQGSMTAGKRCTSNAMPSGMRRFPRLVRFG
jgi:hypothetical protein